MSLLEAIRLVVDGQDLSREQTRAAFNAIMSGEATDAQVAAFIVGLRMKGETIDEIAGAAEVMREKATPVIPADTTYLVDTCGTGGDGSNTFNISTATAFVAAGAGARVAKHGNRSVSSRSGSADVLEALGVNIGIDPQRMKECLDEAGICFLFAPSMHKAMRYAIGPRKEIAVRTVFNVLGPLTNPAGAPCQVLGVFAPNLTEPLAGVLRNLGSRKAYIVHGMDRLDEVSISAETRISELREGAVRTYSVSPSDFGMQQAPSNAVAGGSAQENAAIIQSVFKGEKGPCRDIVLLNAAFAIAAAGLCDTPAEGIKLATESIDSGAAAKKLDALVAMTRR